MIRRILIRFLSIPSICVVLFAIFSAASPLPAQSVMFRGFTTFINPALMAQCHPFGISKHGRGSYALCCHRGFA